MREYRPPPLPPNFRPRYLQGEHSIRCADTLVPRPNTEIPDHVQVARIPFGVRVGNVPPIDTVQAGWSFRSRSDIEGERQAAARPNPPPRVAAKPAQTAIRPAAPKRRPKTTTERVRGQILELLEQHQAPLTLAEIVAELGLERALVHSVLSNAVEQGWVTARGYTQTGRAGHRSQYQLPGRRWPELPAGAVPLRIRKKESQT